MDSTEHDQKSRAEDDLDLRLGRRLIEKERELLSGGASALEAAQLAEEFGASKLIEAATNGLSMLRVELDERLDAVEDANGRYRARLVDHWAEGLHRYRRAFECSKLVGLRLHSRSIEENRGQQRVDLQSALAGTWARSVRTGAEIDVLLHTGFPRGAAARARTLHELAVAALVLSEFGATEEHADLGSRYVAYGAVKVWKDAEEYQQHTAQLGTDPISTSELERYRQERDAAVKMYLRLDRPNGWAARLPGYKNGSFKELEVMAGLDHYRPYYSWFSHEVHSNAKGDRLNMVASPDGQAYHLGLRMDGLADPAHAALRALHQVVAAWSSIMDLKAMDTILLQASRLLVDEAADALAAAEE